MIMHDIYTGYDIYRCCMNGIHPVTHDKKKTPLGNGELFCYITEEPCHNWRGIKEGNANLFS